MSRNRIGNISTHEHFLTCLRDGLAQLLDNLQFAQKYSFNNNGEHILPMPMVQAVSVSLVLTCHVKWQEQRHVVSTRVWPFALTYTDSGMQCDRVRPTCRRCVQQGLTSSGFPADLGFVF